ncbi:MAG TPA: peptide-methionine (S)-S-oxide reductase MsrA, partial [Caulobacterales bacterium]|nr:peptide-methionine (S)-S-oxide reductase MsrA [Caulobacterales bacterium]
MHANPLRREALLMAGAALAGALGLLAMTNMKSFAQADRAARLPAPIVDITPKGDGETQTLIVSGGCFWGVQGVFQHVKGVKQAISGYDGGAAADAHYEIVSTGTTGHAESVMITFDPKRISYGQLLQIFFSVATDPTQVNMQYPDHGPQYRGEIWYLNGEQKKVAEAYIAQINAAKVFAKPIATRVDPNRGFYRAEAHHQDFLTRNPTHPYIVRWDL